MVRFNGFGTQVYVLTTSACTHDRHEPGVSLCLPRLPLTMARGGRFLVWIRSSERKQALERAAAVRTVCLGRDHPTTKKAVASLARPS